MPRRKTARTKVPNLKIEIPGLNITNEMSKEERAEQFDIYLQEYGYKVQHSLKKFRNRVVVIKQCVNQIWDMHLDQIPTSLRDMTLKDFVAAGGTVESVLKLEETKYMEIDKRVGEMHTKEEESYDGFSSQTEQATAFRKTAKAKRNTAARAPESAMGPPVRQSARNTKSRFATPANRFARAGWGATPMITPKFDPRLPITPENIREMKPGERLMSIAGSPVRVADERRKGAVGAAGNTNVEQVASNISSMYGVDLSPRILERVLRVGGLLK